MKLWFQNLKVAQKLMLISIFFVMPDSLMLYLFITGINSNIEFARMEGKGNAYQRPLEELLKLIPEHRLLAQHAGGGEPLAAEELRAKQQQIDDAFAKLEAVDAEIGPDLQFTDEGLAKRKREHYRAGTLHREWQELKARLTGLEPAALGKLHLHLVADLRVMITHAGDLSNLILDPDLDSYYLMDATLLALPQTQDRLAAVIAHAAAVLDLETVSAEERQQFAIYATLLKEADLDRIEGDVQTSLNEDPNFHGASATLQSRVPDALKEFADATSVFIGLTARIGETEKSGVSAKEYLAAGNTAREASFKLWRVAEEELDTLLQRRIETFQTRRTRSLMVAALALVAAICFVTFITRSISGPLRKQAAALRSANDALQAEVAERMRVEVALRTAEEQYRSIFENAVEGIFQSTADGRYLVANPTLARIYGYASVEELKGSVMDIGARLYVDPRRRSEFLQQITQHGTINQFEAQVRRKDGSVIWISENARAVRDAAGALLYYEGKVEDISERKRSELELAKVHKQLLDFSRQAGMAEVATGVLHNVGNVLNSVNVSASLTMERLRVSKVGSFAKATAMLAEHGNDLGDFLTKDPQGQRLPPYLQKLSGFLVAENASMVSELEQLTRNIEHIKEIVAMQQSYARVTGILEDVPPERLIEDALQMNNATFARGGIEIVRTLQPTPPVRVDKHKVLQILINLLRNAKHAVEDTNRPDPRIGVALSRVNGHVEIRVTDNGVGIAPENMPKVFRHGFTTKKNGHGFGLHSGALAAKEMGGALSASSGGPGMGATFTLELPVATAASSS